MSKLKSICEEVLLAAEKATVRRWEKVSDLPNYMEIG